MIQKNIVLLLGIFLFLPLISLAQTENIGPLQPLTAADSVTLSKIPELKMNALALRRTLPAVVDNSSLPYMRPLIGQVGLECGQASSIGIMFTYEINAKRKALGSLPENQYATHFTYNFLNGGNDAGINYFESMHIVKFAGNPNVVDYGGMASGGASRWMSGYDKYYNAMTNRVDGIYAIKTNTLEGLQTLKNWIYDHGEGSDFGGMASFYSQYTSPPSIFPPGTPEAGKHVIYSWGSSPNHAMTIVGYHDSIRWDYNSDGQYTNNIDLNGDGLIDIRDWEIGGFKMANTYGSISGWGDAGFSYMMYKTVADLTSQGGIWNNQVIVAEAKKAYQPMLTAKVNLSYPCRNKLKFMAGVSTDLLSSEPEVVMQYPMFDFQGGCNPMQGSGGPNFEFGLDLNYLLQYVEPGQNARFFFIVIENDDAGSSQGVINSVSLMDYTSGTPQEIAANIFALPIQNNSTTKVGINAAINYDPVSIATDEIPPLELYQPSEAQLVAEGGQDPYRFCLLQTYDTINATAEFPLINGTQLSLSSNDNGTGEVALPFSFPFYGTNYDKIYVAADGFIMFEPSMVTWPYYVAGKSYLIQNKIIAPALAKPFYIQPSAGDGIWAETTNESVTIRWKLSVYGQGGDSEVSMAARLHQNGQIEFFYGTHLAAAYIARFAGISNGDGDNMTILNKTGFFTPVPQQHTVFTPPENLNNITLTKNGLLSANMDHFEANQTINVLVSDRNNIRSITALPLQVQGVLMDYEVVSGDDNIIENGENFRFNFNFENKNAFDLGEATFQITGEDAFVTIIDGQTTIPALAVNESLMMTDLFDLSVIANVENGHQAHFTLHYTTPQGSWTRPIVLTILSPDLHLLTVSVSDGGNGILEPGETANLVVRLHNIGGGKLQNVVAQINTQNADLFILDGEAQTNKILPSEIWEAVFQIRLAADAPAIQVVQIHLEVSDSFGYSYERDLPLMTSLIADGFESGGFDLFDWQMGGTAPWTTTNIAPYEGTYAARSGVIGDNASSVLTLNYEVAYPDTISFFYKVSSETNYDFLKFSINSMVKGEWSGNQITTWRRAAYAVDAGEKVFRWEYTKDYSVSNGTDCGHIDYVVLPAAKIYTGINESENESSYILKVSPNPFTERFTVGVEAAKSGPFELMLTDNNGRILFHQSAVASKGQIIQFEPIGSKSGTGIMFVILQWDQQRIVKPVIRISQ